MSLVSFADRFRRLNVNVAHGRASPHKICMLLAVLDLARGGALTENRIEYAPPLLERYAMYFNAVRGPGDHPNPYFPFFHLAGSLRGGGESFWHLQPRPGRESVFESMSTARTSRQVTENIDHAFLDPELFELVQDPVAVDALSAVLSETWFGRGLRDLDAVVGRTRVINRYERLLRAPSGPALIAAEAVPSYVRDPALQACRDRGLGLSLRSDRIVSCAARWCGDGRGCTHPSFQRSSGRRPAKWAGADARHALGARSLSHRAGHGLPLARESAP